MAGARKKPAKKKMVRGPKHATIKSDKKALSRGFGLVSGTFGKGFRPNPRSANGRLLIKGQKLREKHGWTKSEMFRYLEMERDREMWPASREGKISSKERVMRESLERKHKASAPRKAAVSKAKKALKKAAPKKTTPAKKRAAPLKGRSYR